MAETCHVYKKYMNVRKFMIFISPLNIIDVTLKQYKRPLS